MQPSLNYGNVRAVNDRPSSINASEGCAQPFICPLTKVRVGMSCRIRQLSASPEIAHRLREMGLCEDQQIKLLSQQSNLICQVCNVRLGISAELAEAIWVEPVSKEELAA